MAGEAEYYSHLHGVADRNAEGEPWVPPSIIDYFALDSDDASLRFSSVASSPSSSSSSLRSEVETDDEDDMYPCVHCEYEEIPAFESIPSPLRWWQTKKKSQTSRKSSTGETTSSRSEKLDPAEKLTHFHGRPAFTLKDLKAAPEVFLGEGTYGTVHRATLGDGSEVAVRRLIWMLATEEDEAHLTMLGKIRHPNILPLRAYYSSSRGGDNSLVFDYMPKGSLSAFLHGRLRFITRKVQFSDRWALPALGPYNRIDWPTRKNILIGIARGLHYLHTRKNIVHGNLTGGNVLLDDHSNAKIADYGLSHLRNPAANSNVLAMAGALAYSAPELSVLNVLTTKTDVYSLGVIMLELLTGRSPRNAINGLHLVEWVAWMAEKQWIEKVLDPDLIMDTAGTTRNELLHTLYLALHCVDRSPYWRPEVRQVLQQLKRKKPIVFAGAKLSTTTKDGDKPAEGSADATGTATTASPTAGFVDMSSSLDISEEPGVGTSGTPSFLANDRNLQSRTSSTVNSLNVEVEKPAQLTSKDNLEDGDQIPTPSPAEETIHNHSSKEDSCSCPRLEWIDGVSSPTFNADEVDIMSSKQIALTSKDIVASQLPSIDWADIPIEARLEVPTLPPLLSSAPDSAYQRYFQSLYDLAHRSPPLSPNVLAVQLKRMIMGLHNLGYPLDTWLKAAASVLILARKREYIEHHLDEYCKARVETHLAEITSAMDPFKEEISTTQSHVNVLEQKLKELDGAIAELDDQLALLRTQREGVVGSLTMSQNQIATAEARMRLMLADMERMDQQYYLAVLDLRNDLLGELPSLDGVFDSKFWEILTKEF